jgi:hypothetical protein
MTTNMMNQTELDLSSFDAIFRLDLAVMTLVNYLEENCQDLRLKNDGK